MVKQVNLYKVRKAGGMCIIAFPSGNFGKYYKRIEHENGIIEYIPVNNKIEVCKWMR